MGRGKIEIKRIDNPTCRQLTFCKRRRRLLRKAQELSALCDAEVAVMISSSTGTLFEYASSSMSTICERYGKNLPRHHMETLPNIESDYWSERMTKLKEELEHLESKKRHMMGEDIASLTLESLSQLEQQLDIGFHHVRSRKIELLMEQFQHFQEKEHDLEDENNVLCKRLADIHKSTNGAVQPISISHDVELSETIDNYSFQDVELEQHKSMKSFENSSSSEISIELRLYDNGKNIHEQDSDANTEADHYWD